MQIGDVVLVKGDNSLDTNLQVSRVLDVHLEAIESMVVPLCRQIRILSAEEYKHSFNWQSRTFFLKMCHWKMQSVNNAHTRLITTFWLIKKEDVT